MRSLSGGLALPPQETRGEQHDRADDGSEQERPRQRVFTFTRPAPDFGRHGVTLGAALERVAALAKGASARLWIGVIEWTLFAGSLRVLDERDGARFDVAMHLSARP